MNNNELRVINDSMQKAYERSCLASKPNNYFPAAVEFSRELINPLLNDIRLKIVKQAQDAIASIKETKEATLIEVETTIQLLDSYKEIIPALSYTLKNYQELKKRCAPNSHDMVERAMHLIIEACNLIKYYPGDHRQILAQLVQLDEKNTVIKYIFAPSYHKWIEAMIILEREKKNSLYNSFDYLINLCLYYDRKTRSSKIQWFVSDNRHSIAQYLSMNAENFDMALEEQKPGKAAELGFDVEECKVHMHRVWEFVQSELQNQTLSEQNIATKNFEYKYSDKDGIRTGSLINGENIEELLTGISAALVNFMLKKKQPVSKHEIAETIADDTSDTESAKQVRNAIRTVNNKFKKYFPDDLIIATKNDLWIINPSYRPFIRLKK